MSSDEYYCVLSGVIPKDYEVADDEGDELGDIPLGWIKIQVSRRTLNPEWILTQEIKKQTLEQYLTQVDEDQREEARAALEIQVAAQYASYEDKIGKYEVTEETVYIANPEIEIALNPELISLFENLEIEGEDFGTLEEEEKPIVEPEEVAPDTEPSEQEETA